MTENEYISATTTIISNYRIKELPVPLDENHVKRWLAQFNEQERYVVIKETFHILSRNYIKAERIKEFLSQAIEHISHEMNLENVVFLNLQDKGESQKLLYAIVSEIYNQKYAKKCRILTDKKDINSEDMFFVYIDDGMYTGGRSRQDILPLINDVLPLGAYLKIFYMVAYSNAYSYYERIFKNEAEKRKIKISIEVGHHKNNYRNQKSDYIDFIWPEESVKAYPGVCEYERKLSQTGKANYLYDWESEGYKPGLFSDYESRQLVEGIFLKYGIILANQIGKSSYRPLGITNTPSFGFGSLYVTDFNISNTCPLVLWWGSMEENTSGPIGCWYPLFPRRTNEMMYKEIAEYEQLYSLERYKDVLWTIYRLAQEEKEIQRNNKKFSDCSNIDLNEIVNKRKNSGLFQYMYGLDLDAIKVIQTVMYIGRDYEAPSYTEEEREEIFTQVYEDPDYVAPKKRIRVDNPDEVLLAWLQSLGFGKGWKDKEVEINQIYQKAPLAEYMKRAFDILGL